MIREDLADIRQRYGDERRTEISGEVQILEREDLIAEEDVVVTVSTRGYVKRTKPDAFRAQGRGGKGVIGADLQEEDFVADVFSASTHDYLMLFTNYGLVYWLKVYMIPEMSRTSRGPGAGEPDRAAGGREDHGPDPRQRVRGGPLPADGHRRRHRQEDAAGRLRQEPRRAASSP